MSSTSRGGKRTEFDYYPTPDWCVQRLLEQLLLPPGHWLEPCAGDGAIIRAVNAHRAKERLAPVIWDAVEIRREEEETLKKQAHTVHIADYRTTPESTGYAVAITNPPYRSAEAFLRKAMRHCDNVLMLLRLNFFGSARRHEFLSDHMPAATYVLPNRPSFDNRGTDSIEYAWFHWIAPYTHRETVLKLLALTPAEERCGNSPLVPSTSRSRAADKQSVLAP